MFTSDNGWAMDEHRRKEGKRSAYEEDMKVPLTVRGPNVPQGVRRAHMVLNDDSRRPSRGWEGCQRLPLSTGARSCRCCAPALRAFEQEPRWLLEERVRSGRQWRLLPHDFRRWPTVYYYFRQWRLEKALGEDQPGYWKNVCGFA